MITYRLQLKMVGQHLLLFRQKSHTAHLYRKTKKILNYFEESHGYKIDSHVADLRSVISSGFSENIPHSKLDMIACSQIKLLDTSAMLSVLNTWEHYSPNSLNKTIFYQAFLKLVRKGLWKTLCWNHLVQTIHFVGYLNGDEDSKALMILFLHAIEESNKLSTSHYKDVCIICEAAFRTATGISSPKTLERISFLLREKNADLTKDSVWLVMIIKILVFSKWHKIELMEHLASSWLSSGLLKNAPLTAQCYVFSLFGHASYKDEDFFRSLIPVVERNITNPSQIVRIKDVSMYLWALSTLGFTVDLTNMRKIVLPYLNSQINDYNLSDGLGTLIKTCLSLWMLGIYPDHLLEACLNVKSYNILNG